MTSGLRGTVLTHSFLGTVTRLTVRLDGPDRASVRVDTATDAAPAYPPGSTVHLDVEPAAAMLGAAATEA